MNAMENKTVSGSATLADPRWLAVIAKDAKADGTFYFAVKTTGIYCRPSCAARPPRPENVCFHATCEDAERAGFRPCKRCRPNEPARTAQYLAMVTAACRVIEAQETIPDLAELAARVDISPYHFHRIFKQITGLTPRAYAIAHRNRRLRSQLDVKGTVTEAIYEAGYGSNSRFYEASDGVLGMTPTAFRTGGADTDIRFAVGECSLGAILVAQSDRGICAILMGEDPDELVRNLQDRFSRARLIGGDAAFEQLVARVVGFVESPGIGLALPLDVRGTAFQQRVWQAIQAIPPGQTLSYTELARRIGAPSAVRAVAQACGANALAVAIPCHRVVRHDGGLSGYRWGIERKRALLHMESLALTKKKEQA